MERAPLSTLQFGGAEQITASMVRYVPDYRISTVWNWTVYIFSSKNEIIKKSSLISVFINLELLKLRTSGPNATFSSSPVRVSETLHQRNWNSAFDTKCLKRSPRIRLFASPLNFHFAVSLKGRKRTTWQVHLKRLLALLVDVVSLSAERAALTHKRDWQFDRLGLATRQGSVPWTHPFCRRFNGWNAADST